MSRRELAELLRAACCVSAVDDWLHDAEFDLLKVIGKRVGVSGASLDRLCRQALDDRSLYQQQRFMVTDNATLTVTVLYEIAIADGKLLPAEAQLVRHFANRLNVDPATVAAIEAEAAAKLNAQHADRNDLADAVEAARADAAPAPPAASAKMQAQLKSVMPFLIVADIHAAVAFYVDKLGFTCQRLIPEDDPFFAIVRRDRVGFMLKHIGSDVPPTPNPTRHEWARWDAWVHVDHPDTLYADLPADLDFPDPIGFEDGLHRFSIRDADGYVIAFGCPAEGRRD